MFRELCLAGIYGVIAELQPTSFSFNIYEYVYKRTFTFFKWRKHPYYIMMRLIRVRDECRCESD